MKEQEGDGVTALSALDENNIKYLRVKVGKVDCTVREREKNTLNFIYINKTKGCELDYADVRFKQLTLVKTAMKFLLLKKGEFVV